LAAPADASSRPNAMALKAGMIRMPIDKGFDRIFATPKTFGAN